MSKPTSNSQDVVHKQIHYPLWFGGSASCLAACVTHPLDLCMIAALLTEVIGPRSQFSRFGFKLSRTKALAKAWSRCLSILSRAMAWLGYTGVYVFCNMTRRRTAADSAQLSASLMRQVTYSTTRFGVYEELKQTFSTGVQSPSFPALIAMASTSGFLGGIAGNPADILNVRMQNDASLPAAERRNYKNAIDGLVRMVREEGFASVFRGVWPNSSRAVLMTASQLASYDIFKNELIERANMGESLTTHFTASFMAGFVATTICSPVDVIKTRVMSAKTKEGIVSLITRITADEGFMWAFRGWLPSFVRLGPHTIATFLFLEQHKKFYRSMHGLES